MTGRKRSQRQLDNDRIIEEFLSTFPPSVPWNKTVTRQEYIKLNRVLRKFYSTEQIIDAIRYAKMRGKQYKTISSIAFVIEESIQYWSQLREREEERRKLAEEQVVVNTPIETEHKPSTPSG